MNTAPRIMIAGARGFVGSRALEHFPSAVCIDSALLRSPGPALRDLVLAHEPQIILNTAAISDIGTCEKDPAASFLANVHLPVELAKAAKETGAKLISFSSDQVYTGCLDAGPYSEDLSLPEPRNVYARHKMEAEQRVLDLHPQSVMLRATWMYDMPMFGHANRGNFLVNTLDALIQGRSIPVPARQYRGITYVRQVVELLDQVFTLPGGIYNYGSENPLTMVQTLHALLDALGAEACVQEMEGSRHNLWMDCNKLKSQGIVFDTTAQGFRRCLKDYRLGQL